MSSAHSIPEDVKERVDGVTQRLRGWISSIVPGLSCAVLPVGSAPDEGASLALLRIVPGKRPRDAGSPLELRLEYICTLTAADPLDAHRIVGEIAFAAMASNEYEPAPAENDGTALVLSARLLRARAPRPAPRVREPLGLNLQVAGDRGERRPESVAAPGGKIISLRSEG